MQFFPILSCMVFSGVVNSYLLSMNFKKILNSLLQYLNTFINTNLKELCHELA